LMCFKREQRENKRIKPHKNRHSTV
jgi:hypothetical protein